MKIQQLLVEYVQVDQKKLDQRLQLEYDWESIHPETAEDMKITTPAGLIKYLEKYDPSPKNKYVNWMLTRYMQGGMQQGGITRLEDISNGVTQALERFEELKNGKKLGADADINKLKGLSDLNALVRKFADEKIDTKKGRSKDIKVVLDTDKHSIQVPKTYEASKELACNTDWCTAFPDMYRQYSNQGPLYIITDKETGDRWQFHWESEQFMDEQDQDIETQGGEGYVVAEPKAALIQFLSSRPEVAKVFEKMGKYKIEGDSWIFPLEGKVISDGSFEAYDEYGSLHRDESKGPAKVIKDREGTFEEYYQHGDKHRENGPAYIRQQGNPKSGDITIEKWYTDDDLHRDPADGPAVTSYLDKDTGEIDPSLINTRDWQRVKFRYERHYFYWVNGNEIANSLGGEHKEGGPLKAEPQQTDEAYERELQQMLDLAGINRGAPVNDLSDPMHRIGPRRMADRVPPPR